MNSPAKVAENYVNTGLGKMRLSIPKMLVLGFLAGMFIAFGALASQVSAVSIAAPSVGKLVGAILFSVGLMMVLCAGSELFTGNCLLIIPVLEKKGSVALMLRNWLFVYIGNFLGGLFVALMANYGHIYSLFDSKLAASVVTIAAGKATLSFSDALIRGVLCNILVCIAVWISFAASEQAGKILGLMPPVILFVLCGFEHSVANMYFIPAGLLASGTYGIAADGLSVGSFLLGNLLPVTIGNIIGGCIIVGCGYWFCYLRKGK